MKITATKANRIWLELELDADKAVCNIRAALATNVMRKLGDPSVEFFYLQEKKLYAISSSSGGGLFELKQNGYWFNLDVVGE